MEWALVMLLWYYGASEPVEFVHSRYGGPSAEATCNEVKDRLLVDDSFGNTTELFCINAKYYQRKPE